MELIVGVLKCRPPGMRINLIPLYSWYMLVAAAMVLFAFPPLIAGSLLLELERAFQWPFFDPTRGGDPLLWQHLFWIFGHPGGLHRLSAVGRARRDDRADVRAHADRRLQLDRARRGGHRVPELRPVGAPHVHDGAAGHLARRSSRRPRRPSRFRPACSSSASSPRCWWDASSRSVPMLFVIGGLATFVLGGLTGVMVAMAPFNFQAHDTFFIVGHLHTVLIGGTVFPIVAGFYYFFPLVTGKKLSDRLGRIAFWLMFVGFNVTFLPMHLTGLRGMVRRVLHLSGRPRLRRAESGLEHRRVHPGRRASWSSSGTSSGRSASEPYSERNPWNAGTLEWLAEMPSPAVGRALDSRDRQPLSAVGSAELHARCRRGPLLPAGRRGGPAGDDRHDRRRRRSRCSACALGGNTFLTLFAAAVHRRHLHLLDVSLVVAGARQRACWRSATHPDVAVDGHGGDSREAGEGRRLGLTLPIYVSGPSSVGWWGMFITMLGDPDGVHQPRVRLLLLLDGAPGLSARSDRRAPACGGRRSRSCCLLGRLAADGAGPAMEPAWTRAAGSTPRCWPPRVLAAAGAAALHRRAVDHRPRSRRRHVYGAIVWMLVIWTRGARRRRHHHAAVLRRAPSRRPHDRAARPGHRQRHAVLAFRRGHGRSSPWR